MSAPLVHAGLLPGTDPCASVREALAVIERVRETERIMADPNARVAWALSMDAELAAAIALGLDAADAARITEETIETMLLHAERTVREAGITLLGRRQVR